MVSKAEEKELKKHYKPDNTNITVIHGCYVDPEGNIIATFADHVSAMTEDVVDKYMNVFRKVLSGKDGITRFSVKTTEENSDTLVRLMDKAMKDDEDVESFYYDIIAGTSGTEIGPFLILAACDSYDIPGIGSDGLFTDESEGVFSHMICAVCPVKDTKPVLGFARNENKFKNMLIPDVAGNPIAGFMYPDFNYRMPDSESATIFCGKDNLRGIFGNFFNGDIPSAKETGENIGNIIAGAFEGECTCNTVANINATLTDMIRSKSEGNPDEYPKVSAREIVEVLENCGLDKDKLAETSQKIVGVMPSDKINIEILTRATDTVETGNFKITAPAGTTRNITTEERNGKKYLIIPADEVTTVNGIKVSV